MAALPAPRHLAATGKKLWRETTSKYELRQDELETLKAACGEADLIERMQVELKGSNLTVDGSMGQIVIHPLVQEIRQHRATMAGLLRGLKLPDEVGSAGTENQQRAAAQTRWAAAHGRSA